MPKKEKKPKKAKPTAKKPRKPRSPKAPSAPAPAQSPVNDEPREEEDETIDVPEDGQGNEDTELLNT